jgi:rubredoxin
MPDYLGPPRGLPRYRFYCPQCQRHGVQAWQNILYPSLPVDPETFTCPDCNVRVEILGREDQ